MGAENQALRQRRIATGITRQRQRARKESVRTLLPPPSQTNPWDCLLGISECGQRMENIAIDDVLTIKTRIRQTSSCNNAR